MKEFLLLTIVVLITISHVAETRPKEHLRQKNRDSQTEQEKYVGCVFPYQFVNPYYHTFTARSCANILLDRAQIPLRIPDDYHVGCDCIPGFAMNYQGYCIDESQCDLWEAFGTLINEGAIGSNVGGTESLKQEQDQVKQNEKDPQKQEEIQQFYGESEESPSKAQDLDLNELKSQDFNSIEVNSRQLNDNNGINKDEDEDDCCDEDNKSECCECSDETTSEVSDENSTEKQTANLILPDSLNELNSTTPMAPLIRHINDTDSAIDFQVETTEPNVLEQPSVVGEKNQILN